MPLAIPNRMVDSLESGVAATHICRDHAEYGSETFELILSDLIESNLAADLPRCLVKYAVPDKTIS